MNGIARGQKEGRSLDTREGVSNLLCGRAGSSHAGNRNSTASIANCLYQFNEGRLVDRRGKTLKL
jgi:hypothetical protein